jgi:hypothetical protein
MYIMSRLVAGGYLKFLIGIERQDVRSVHAVFLVEYRLGGRGSGTAQPLGDVKDNVGEAAVSPNHVGFHLPGIGSMSLGAEGILAHIDALHVRGGTIQLDGACNFAFARGIDFLAKDERSNSDQQDSGQHNSVTIPHRNVLLNELVAME